ncbi:MAG: FCD domain-containing protein [Aquincola tertiaricarbonis]
MIAQHRKIVRAIARRDEDKAAAAAMEHVEASRRDLLRLLDQPGRG